MPLAVDLCCGLGGWTEGLLAEGYDARGYDIEEHVYGEERYPAELVLRDILKMHGSEVADADLIVASPPCQEYSYMAMPWKLAKAKRAAILADTSGAALERLNAIFNACFRIQREANVIRAAKGLPPVPMVLENVRGAQEWVGRAAWNFGSYYLWGDVPALMPRPTASAVKHPGMSWSGSDAPGYVAVTFNDTRHDHSHRDTSDGRKVPGFRFDGSGKSFQTESVLRHVEGVKVPTGAGRSPTAPGSSNRFTSMEANEGGKGGIAARKAAAAHIAKIPFALSSHIARVYRP